MKKPTFRSFCLYGQLLAAAFLASPQDSIANQDVERDARYVWDLTEFYESKAVWETELERLRREVDLLAPLRER